MNKLIPSGKVAIPTGTGKGPFAPKQVALPAVSPGFAFGHGQTPGGNPLPGAVPLNPTTMVPEPHESTPALATSSPAIVIPKYTPALRKALAEGQSGDMIEAICKTRHDVNVLEVALARIEQALRLNASAMPGPLQPNLQTQVAAFDIGSVAGTTTVLGTQVSFDAEVYLQAFIGGQFVTTTAVYANNPTRWQLRRTDKMFFAVEFDGSTSSLIGMGEEVFGNNLDHWFEFPNPLPILLSDILMVDVRNEGATTYNTIGALMFATRYPTQDPGFNFAPNPRVAVFRSGAFTNNAGPQIYTFRNPARIVGFRGHAEPTAGSATTTAVRINLRTSQNFQITLGQNSGVVDQLLFGVNNQRTWFLTHPIYMPAGSSLQCSWANNIDSSPASLSHNVAAIFQEAR